ncbi:hypothetical protein niasHT_007503 [Heterodera trifolii]|uniref:Lon proteolytic domain-containing protein n=1 Tax=Heterodera trifolii TaxID=157864 RepID=A0ABD2LR16_9BILA
MLDLVDKEKRDGDDDEAELVTAGSRSGTAKGNHRSQLTAYGAEAVDHRRNLPTADYGHAGPKKFTHESYTTRGTWVAMRTAYRLACVRAPAFFNQHSIVLKTLPFDEFTGPSASPVTFAALVALGTGRRLLKNATATGHLFDDGSINHVGSIYLKVGAVRRAKRYKMVMPEANRRDYQQLCCLHKRKMKAESVNNTDRLLEELLAPLAHWFFQIQGLIFFNSFRRHLPPNEATGSLVVGFVVFGNHHLVPSGAYSSANLQLLI